MKRENTLYFRHVMPLVLIIMTFVSQAESTQTEIWKTSTFEEFQHGEATQVTLTQTGEITLAPHVQEILALQGDDLLVWSLVQDSNGNLYAGTGEQGKIFKISSNGDVSLFFDSPEVGIISLAVDDQDNVYAGSTPDGLIYKITPEGGQTTFFMTEEHYVWALEFGPDNVLYAGTGESGKIFKILPDGAGTLLYDSPQTHIMSLLLAPQGWLYAGTEGKGITYKVDLDGKAFVLQQAQEEESHALALDSQGNLYVAAISNKIFPEQNAPAHNEQQPAQQEQGLKKSTIYKISPQGALSTFLELPEILIYAMEIDSQDHLLIGTDQEGMLYRVLPNGEYHQILKVEANNIVALDRTANGRMYVGTGDPGSVSRVEPQLSEQGEYLSIVHDAKTTSTWGKIFWRATSQQLSLFTRTGNTSKPDDTWSSWSEDLQNKEGTDIPNPPARFIQWKAEFAPDETQGPILEEVSIAYLPDNLAPEIKQIHIFHGGEPRQEEPVMPVRRKTSGNSAPSLTPPGNPRNPKNEPKPPQFIPPGHIAIIWEAQDPNSEELLYAVSLQGAQEPLWNILEEDQDAPAYLLDTTTLPDGDYYIKITATDKSNNPSSNALQTEKISERFEVDNTAPLVSIALNQKQDNDIVLVTVIARDEFSRLQTAEYSVDAGDWMAIFPEDHVTDSREEKYSINLPDLTPGAHVLVFKATDTFENVGVGKILFSVPEESQPQSEPVANTEEASNN